MMKTFKNSSFSKLLANNTDILFAFLIILVVALLVIPIPAFLIDIFISANIFCALLILLISIYIPSALSLSSFPTILLLTTLFRLGLNVATSRLILLHADAGEVILAFGNSVVGGNLVVGIVIFLLLMLINMLVVAKGSERVAEVAARFSLDAMPGKQMSIDADLRSGILDLEQAKQKRQDLSRESQLFGAMDGAMKFVKGDVIAGIVIFFINILAGIIIGKTQLDMDIYEALQTFSILSVGDGLVSIIPSLLMSICAGLIVTRVESGTHNQNLSQEINSQLSAYPKAFLLAGVFVIIIGQAPGLPSIPFSILGILGIVFGVIGLRATKSVDLVHQNNLEPMEAVGEENFITGVVPICIEVSPELVNLVNEESEFIPKFIPMLRESLFMELGVRFPGIRVKAAYEGQLPKFSYVVFINEIPIDSFTIKPDECLVNVMPHELLALGINDVSQSINHATNLRCSVTNISHRDLLIKAGLEFFDPASRILLHVASILRKNAKDFISVEETQVILDQLEKSSPALVREVMPKVVSLYQLSDIFRRLLSEGISIKDTKTILQALAEHGLSSSDTIILTEQVRQSLSRSICYNHSQNQDTLLVFLLSPQIEDIFSTSIERSNLGSFLAIDPEIRKQVLQSLNHEITNMPPRSKKPIILVSQEIRRFVRKLIENDFFDVAVISYQELHPDFKVQPIGHISLEEAKLYQDDDDDEESLEMLKLSPNLA